MRNKEVISFLGLCESINNENFKRSNSTRLKMKPVVINLKCLRKNGYKKQTLLVLFLNPVEFEIKIFQFCHH